MKADRNGHLKTLCACLALTLALAVLPGCMKVGPDYTDPNVQMPANWRAADKDTAKADQARELADWWKAFGDPLLDRLLEKALAGNLDLKKAVSAVRQARAKRRMATGDLYPAATAKASSSASKSRKDDLSWYDKESHRLGLDLSWELDLFGRIRREVEAAAAESQAAEEDMHSVRVSLVAETASAYISLRTYQKRLTMARENLRLQEETLKLTSIKFQTGMAGALDVEQASYSLESTRSQIPDLETGLKEMKNSLAVLLGSWPGDLDRELESTAPIPAGSSQVVLGVPADLLRRRPDIRAAERRLAAQTAKVGVAEGDLYPKLTVSGSLAYESLGLTGLISPAAMVAALGGAVSWQIFNQESIRGNIQVQTELQKQALLTYESTLRTAVREVENALTRVLKENEKQKTLTRAVASARAAAALALQGYESGISDFQSVLETQQSLTSLEDRLSQSRGLSAQNIITLYKALGGGWSPKGLPLAETAGAGEKTAAGLS